MKHLPDATYREIQYRWQELASVAGGIIPSRLPLEPEPADVDAIAGDLRLLIATVDSLLEAYGAHAAAYLTGIDESLFRRQLAGALEGNALWELQSAAERLAEEARERI